MRKRGALIALIFLTVAAVAAQPAAACEDWWGYNRCMDEADAGYSACLDNCEYWLYQDPPDTQAWQSCTDFCNWRMETAECRCYTHCDPWAICPA